jgi:hypothetical protein
LVSDRPGDPDQESSEHKDQKSSHGKYGYAEENRRGDSELLKSKRNYCTSDQIESLRVSDIIQTYLSLFKGG